MEHHMDAAMICRVIRDAVTPLPRDHRRLIAVALWNLCFETFGAIRIQRAFSRLVSAASERCSDDWALNPDVFCVSLLFFVIVSGQDPAGSSAFCDRIDVRGRAASNH